MLDDDDPDKVATQKSIGIIQDFIVERANTI